MNTTSNEASYNSEESSSTMALLHHNCVSNRHSRGRGTDGSDGSSNRVIRSRYHQLNRAADIFYISTELPTSISAPAATAAAAKIRSGQTPPRLGQARQDDEDDTEARRRGYHHLSSVSYKRIVVLSPEKSKFTVLLPSECDFSENAADEDWPSKMTSFEALGEKKNQQQQSSFAQASDFPFSSSMANFLSKNTSLQQSTDAESGEKSSFFHDNSAEKPQQQHHHVSGLLHVQPIPSSLPTTSSDKEGQQTKKVRIKSIIASGEREVNDDNKKDDRHKPAENHDSPIVLGTALLRIDELKTASNTDELKNNNENHHQDHHQDHHEQYQSSMDDEPELAHRGKTVLIANPENYHNNNDDDLRCHELSQEALDDEELKRLFAESLLEALNLEDETMMGRDVADAVVTTRTDQQQQQQQEQGRAKRITNEDLSTTSNLGMEEKEDEQMKILFPTLSREERDRRRELLRFGLSTRDSGQMEILRRDLLRRRQLAQQLATATAEDHHLDDSQQQQLSPNRPNESNEGTTTTVTLTAAATQCSRTSSFDDNKNNNDNNIINSTINSDDLRRRRHRGNNHLLLLSRDSNDDGGDANAGDNIILVRRQQQQEQQPTSGHTFSLARAITTTSTDIPPEIIIDEESPSIPSPSSSSV